MRTAALLALAATLISLGCRDQRPCNEKTVMLNIKLAGEVARDADQIRVQASVDGVPVTVGEPLARPAGQNQGSIEVRLGSHYRVTAEFTVVATALRAGAVLAEVRMNGKLQPGCMVLDLLTLGEEPDAGAGGDARDASDARTDGRDTGSPPDGSIDVPPIDMPPPVDMPMPIDMPLPVDLPVDLPPDMMNPCPGACIAGTAMACGMCGMRMCLPNCTWGACMGQGTCAPNASEACGNCNTGRRTCSASCTWGDCMAETGCRPGATRPCDDCQGVMQTCSAQCAWSVCSCPMTPKRVFVTRERQSGNMGGLMGAHALCTRLANDAGLTGQYRAWLSTATSGPANFMTRNPGPYVLPGGEMVATSWADLTDGTLLRPIDRDQTGMPVNPQFVCEGGEVWTNTTASGTPASALDCTGWFGTPGSSQAGNLRFANARWTNSGCTAIACATDMQIYCFEQ
jgi:hypothetical protein